MDRDIKRAKGADELPIATEKERILDYSKIDQLEEELRARDAIIERLTREVRHPSCRRIIRLLPLHTTLIFHKQIRTTHGHTF